MEMCNYPGLQARVRRRTHTSTLEFVGIFWVVGTRKAREMVSRGWRGWEAKGGGCRCQGSSQSTHQTERSVGGRPKNFEASSAYVWVCMSSRSSRVKSSGCTSLPTWYKIVCSCLRWSTKTAPTLNQRVYCWPSRLRLLLTTMPSAGRDNKERLCEE